MNRPPLTDEDGEVRELTADDVKLMRPLAVVDPVMTAAMRNKGGRPIERPKVHAGFRIAADVAEGIKATGRGYNGRVETVLREALEAGKLDAPRS